MDDLDITTEVESEISLQDRALDAPTLSQIISAAEQREAEQAASDAQQLVDDQGDAVSMEVGADYKVGDDAIEFDLGDDGDIQIDESSELGSALQKLESEKAIVEAAADAGQEDDSDEDEITAEALEQEDSYLSELSEQSASKMEPYHESETALELAKAYLELGEKDIAKGFIEEVINEGSDKQKEKAKKLVKELAD